MADSSPGSPDLSTHPLVAFMQGNSDTPTGLVTVTGYFGPAQKAGAIRLYPSLDFRTYFEVPTAAIIATRPADEDDELSPTVVYLKAGTLVEAPTHPVESYLHGEITGGYMQEATTGVFPAHVGVMASKCTVCPCHPSTPGLKLVHFPPGEQRA